MKHYFPSGICGPTLIPAAPQASSSAVSHLPSGNFLGALEQGKAAEEASSNHLCFLLHPSFCSKEDGQKGPVLIGYGRTGTEQWTDRRIFAL